MGNLGYLEWRPDRRDYDAALRTRAILRSLTDAASVGDPGVRNAIRSACYEGGANFSEVLGFIAGNQEPQINRGGDVGEANVGDVSLTMADVERGVIAAR